MERVADRAASTACAASATIIAHLSWTKSLARPGRRSGLPAEYRFSSFMFFPSIQPSSFRACVNARTRRCACWSVSVVPARIPITGVDPLRSGQPRGQPGNRDRAKCCNELAPSHCRPPRLANKINRRACCDYFASSYESKDSNRPNRTNLRSGYLAMCALDHKRTSAAQSGVSKLKGPPRW